MKHAGADALAALEGLRASLRELPGVVERTPGCFYRRGIALLHFHEDAAGLFADAKLDGRTFQRLRVTTPPEQRQCLDALRALAATGPARRT